MKNRTRTNHFDGLQNFIQQSGAEIGSANHAHASLLHAANKERIQR
jgi:hypothetical protein